MDLSTFSKETLINMIQDQQKLINDIEFSKMASGIALKEIKKINSLPLDYI